MDCLLWINMFVNNNQLWIKILSPHTGPLWKTPLLCLWWMSQIYLHLGNSSRLPSSVLLEAPAVSISAIYIFIYRSAADFCWSGRRQIIPPWLRRGKNVGGDFCSVTKWVGVASRGRTCFFFPHGKSSFPSPNPHQASVSCACSHLDRVLDTLSSRDLQWVHSVWSFPQHYLLQAARFLEIWLKFLIVREPKGQNCSLWELCNFD